MSRASASDGSVDPEILARQISDRARSIERRQVEVAMTKLDDNHREAVLDLADRLVSECLDGPMGALESAAERDDTETVRTIARLFDIASEDIGEIDDPGPSDDSRTAEQPLASSVE